MDMTLQEYIWPTGPGVTTQVTDMGASREGTKTYTVIFHGDVETVGGYTFYDWIQCYYIVTDLQDVILTIEKLDPALFQQ